MYKESVVVEEIIDCKTVGFFLKISKEIGKAWREARESHTPVGRVRRERKKRLSVFHTMRSFRPGGSKMSSSCQKSVHNSALFVNLIHSVTDFEGEKRVLLSVLGFVPCRAL